MIILDDVPFALHDGLWHILEWSRRGPVHKMRCGLEVRSLLQGMTSLNENEDVVPVPRCQKCVAPSPKSQN